MKRPCLHPPHVVKYVGQGEYECTGCGREVFSIEKYVLVRPKSRAAFLKEAKR